MWERIVIWSANRFRRYHLFDVDIANTGTDITSLPEFRQADVIHLHWINQGMLSLNDIRKILTSGKPVVWTMHDMWPCTGICHYARECNNYQQECHDCPYIYKGGDERIYPIARSAKTEVIQLCSHSFRHVQPLAEGTSPDQCIVRREKRHQYSECHQHQSVQAHEQEGSACQIHVAGR